MEWTHEVTNQLRTLWDEGLPTVEIEYRLGVSKSAINRKAYRLDLPARPSPIKAKTGAAPASAAVRPVAGPTLLTLPSTTPENMAEIIPSVIPRRPERVVECLWPVGDPGSPGFHFCCKPTEQGKPFCGEHTKLGYVKVRPLRTDFANI